MIEIILDEGLVIDAYARVGLVGIGLLTIDARIVVASVDTYLRFAEAVARADIARERGVETADRAVGGWLDGERRKAVTKGAIDGVMEALGFGDTRQ